MLLMPSNYKRLRYWHSSHTWPESKYRDHPSFPLFLESVVLYLQHACLRILLAGLLSWDRGVNTRHVNEVLLIMTRPLLLQPGAWLSQITLNNHSHKKPADKLLHCLQSQQSVSPLGPFAIIYYFSRSLENNFCWGILTFVTQRFVEKLLFSYKVVMNRKFEKWWW